MKTRDDTGRHMADIDDQRGSQRDDGQQEYDGGKVDIAQLQYDVKSDIIRENLRLNHEVGYFMQEDVAEGKHIIEDILVILQDPIAIQKTATRHKIIGHFINLIWLTHITTIDSNAMMEYFHVLLQSDDSETMRLSTLEMCELFTRHLCGFFTSSIYDDDMGARNPALPEILHFIDTHYQEDISCKDIAQYLHFTTTYIGRLFKKHMGVNLSQYLLEYRIAKAKTLLLRGDLLIQDIAEQVGMNDASYFSRTFRRYVGCSPSNYKKQHRKGKTKTKQPTP